MKKPPIPEDEAARLEALFQYNVLDTDPEEHFDELTEVVASVLGVPIALVSLVDETRQWFKSHHGLDATETPRELAFCAHAILGDEIFEVPDSLKDDRFADNPLVTDAPNVRFYAGMPLITPTGHKIGTLCAIDHKPRHLSDEERRILQIVATQVITQLELKRNATINEELFRKQTNLLKDLEQANKEVRDFAYIVSHDMRAPLVNIQGFSDELTLGAQNIKALVNQYSDHFPEQFNTSLARVVDDDIESPLDFIRRGVSQLNSRINSILELSQHGQRRFENEPIDLNTVFKDVAGLHQMELQQCGGIIEVSELPVINIDRGAITHVIENLIGNAVKYRDHERALCIRVSADVDVRGTTLRIQDNGRGIAESDINRVFEMFRRVGAQDTQGSGVGLAHIQMLVRRLEGRLWCDSVLGEGSTFHVFLPLLPALEKQQTAAGF